jgi:hypothetical protein
MLKYSEYYSIRLPLIQDLIKVFYEVLWDKESDLKEKLLLDNIVGKHKEGAFVEFRVNENC